MDDLRQCPFCGGHTMSVHTATAMNGELWSVVFCDDCGAESASGLGKNGATEKWNTRPIEDDLRRELEQSQAEIKALNRRVAQLVEYVDTGAKF